MDYFKQINNTIQSLIKNHQLKQAVNMIQEQLKTFVPEPYFSNWKKLLYSLSKELNAKELNNQFNQWYQNLKENELINNLVKNHKVDFNFLQLYWKKFPFNENQSQFFAYLLNSNVINQEDKFLLFYLIASKTNESYLFFNELTNVHQNVNKNMVIDFEKYQHQLNDFFNEQIKKDVTIRQWCHQCLDLMVIYYFPIFPSHALNISNEKLGQLIIKYVNDCQLNKLDNSSLIAKIMHHFN